MLWFKINRHNFVSIQNLRVSTFHLSGGFFPLARCNSHKVNKTIQCFWWLSFLFHCCSGQKLICQRWSVLSRFGCNCTEYWMAMVAGDQAGFSHFAHFAFIIRPVFLFASFTDHHHTLGSGRWWTAVFWWDRWYRRTSFWASCAVRLRECVRYCVFISVLFSYLGVHHITVN